MRARAAAAVGGLALVLVVAPAYATTIKWTAFGTQGDNGWYVSDIYINWTVTDYTPPITDDQCPRSVHLTADTAGVQVSCSITTSADGTVSAKTPPIKVDRTPPTALAAMPDRLPDAGTWYNHPLAITWSGTDAMSGIASCTTLSYSGPDSGSAKATGGCRDVAGNSATVPFSLSYDATPPALTGVTPLAGDHRIVLRWSASPDTVLTQVVRSPGLAGASSSRVYSGTDSSFVDSSVANGRDYRYTVTAYDAAANSSSSTVSTMPSLALRPANGARLRQPPLLRWPRVKRARYYNVQLFRGKRKILSAWPGRPGFKLRAGWVYGGKRRHLSRGRYHWYVWPGFGSRAAHRYGALIGHASFSIVR